MNDFLNTAIGIGIAIAAIIIAVIIIVSKVIEYFKGNKYETIHECGEAIDILKKDLDILREEVNKLRAAKHETNNKLQEILIENEKFKAVFQGIDPASVDYRKQGLEVFTVAREAYRVITQIDERSVKIEENIQKLYAAIEQHLKAIEINQRESGTTQ